MESMNQRDKSCFSEYMMVFHIENSSCPFPVERSHRVTSFEAHGRTFLHGSMYPFYISRSDRWGKKKKTYLRPCASSSKDKSAVAQGDNRDFNPRQAVCAQCDVQPNPLFSHKQRHLAEKYYKLFIGTMMAARAPCSLMAVCPDPPTYHHHHQKKSLGHLKQDNVMIMLTWKTLG